MSIPQQELLQWENILNSLKVNELASLMTNMGSNRLGKKAELVAKAMSFLRSSTTQARLIQLLREQHRVYPQRAIPMQRTQQMMQAGYHGAASNGTGGFNGYNGTMASQAFPGNIKRLVGLKPVPLPFFDPCEECMTPVELPSSPQQQKINAKQLLTFGLPANRIHYLNYRSDVSPLPRYEVQLRFFYLADNYQNTEQPDEFPLNCQVKIDDHMIQLPPIIPTNRPNVEAKRPSRPVNITPTLQSLGVGTGKSYKLTVDWTADKRRWGVTVGIVYRTNTSMLLKRMDDKVDAKQALDVTRNTIIRRLGTGDEDGIAMEQLKTSLRCPLMRTRLAIPVRCRDCTHLQCYDLFNYLSMNEKRPTWKCPVCSNPAPYNRLIVDQYFVKVIDEVPTNVEEVELLRDGSWQIIKEESDSGVSDEDVKPFIKKTENGKRPADSGDTPGPQPKKKVDEDIITLDSDDEDTQIAVANSLSDCHVTTASGDANKHKSSTPSQSRSSIEIITLEDTPPRSNAATESSAMPSSSASMTSAPPRNMSLPNLPASAASVRSVNSSGATSSPGLSSNPSPVGPGTLHDVLNGFFPQPQSPYFAFPNTLGAAAPPGPGSMIPTSYLANAPYQNLNVFPQYNATSMQAYSNYANGYQRPGQHLAYNLQSLRPSDVGSAPEGPHRC